MQSGSANLRNKVLMAVALLVAALGWAILGESSARPDSNRVGHARGPSHPEPHSASVPPPSTRSETGARLLGLERASVDDSPAPPATRSWIVWGTVKAADTPVSGARVRVVCELATSVAVATSPDGTYRVELPRPGIGTISITASTPGWVARATRIDATSFRDGVAQVDIRLEAGRELCGTLLRGGRPAAGAVVTVHPDRLPVAPEPPARALAWTDAMGGFSVPVTAANGLLREPVLLVHANHGELGTGIRSIALTEHPTTEVGSIQLVDAHVVNLRLTFQSGAPLAGALVRVSRVGGSILDGGDGATVWTQVADAGGSLLLRGMAAGRHAVTLPGAIDVVPAPNQLATDATATTEMVVAAQRVHLVALHAPDLVTFSWYRRRPDDTESLQSDHNLDGRTALDRLVPTGSKWRIVASSADRTLTLMHEAISGLDETSVTFDFDTR